ncbi:hypothetical protein [Curtobacterium sp. Curtsp57]|uniref:hypothetical protein n=1 Tax=Curtobacterium sp. Curtsp57 TaxID=3243047 RepID=UPI0039B517D9
MSEATKVRPPRTGRPAKTNQSAEGRVSAEVAERTKRQGRANMQLLTVGARPRVDLLPTEVLVDRRERRVVRRVWGGVAVVAVVAGIAIGGASLMSAESANDLADAQAQTLALVQQQAQYKDVRETEASTSLLEAAQAVGGATEIDWGTYLGSVKSSLPGGVDITGVTVDSASPLEAYAQADAPLQGQRIATLTFDAESPTLPSVPEWLDSVRSITGFVDATANSVTLDETSGTYTVNMTIHVNEKAFDGKYDLDGGK